MADDASKGASSSKTETSDHPESSIEIKIKTLDSQVYKLRVDKDVPVLVLKEKIVDATGVPVNQQRLIFRGKVLKDDHHLSEYHLEDGYTLHLVARRAPEGQHSSGTSEENAHTNVNVAGNGGVLGDISREIIEAMHSEGMLDDVARGVRDILGSLGIGLSGGVTNTTISVPLTTAPEGANNISGRTQPGNPAQPGFAILNQQIQVSHLQPTGAVPRNMVIPDSMMTLLEFINLMDQILQNNGTPPSVDSNAQQPPRSDDAYPNPRFPSPEVLVSVLDRAQQLLGGSAASALSNIAQWIQRDAGTSDASLRSQIQSESIQLGVAMQHLGAMLLELGRTMMMLRMGPSPAEAFVNAGSAVYINSTGPNPMMVQPSFQMSPMFGVSNVPVVNGVSGPVGIVDPSQTSGVGDPSRNISVNIHGGWSAGMVTAAEDANGSHQNGERTQGGNPSAYSTSIRGLPTRTVVAAIPARSPVETPSHVLSVVLPVQVRTQAAVPNQPTLSQGSQTAVGNGSQPNPLAVVPQTSLGATSIPAIVAQVTAHVASALAVSAPGQVLSTAQNTGDQGSHVSTNNGIGTLSSATSASGQTQSELSSSNQGQTSSLDVMVQSHVAEAGTLSSRVSEPNLISQDSSAVDVYNVGSIQPHAQMEENQGINRGNGIVDSGELVTGSLAGQPTATCTSGVPLSISAEKSVQKSELLDGVAAQPSKPSANDQPAPIGLGGGLQPKRRGRTAKPSGSSGDSAEPIDSSCINRSQGALSRSQQVLQALISQSTDANRSDSTPSSTPQSTDGMPPRRQGGEGQVDIGSMISSVLNTPVFSNLLSNVAAQTGVGSAADLRNMMEQCTQSPAMRDTIGNIVQNVDGQDLGAIFGSGSGQGGIDFSRMMQQMMPVVSQVLGGVPASPVGTSSGQSTYEPQHNDSRAPNVLDGRSSQIDLHQACQHIEEHDSPENIFGAVLESAAQAYGGDGSIQGILQELVSDPELASDYVKLLVQQVRQRIQSESESSNLS